MRMSRRAGLYGHYDDGNEWTYLYFEGDQCTDVTGGWVTAYGVHGGTVNMDYSYEGHRCIYVSTMDATSLAHDDPRAYAYTSNKFDLSKYDEIAMFIAKPNESATVSTNVKCIPHTSPNEWDHSWGPPSDDRFVHGVWTYASLTGISYSDRICVDTYGWDYVEEKYAYHSGQAISGIALLKRKS